MTLFDEQQYFHDLEKRSGSGDLKAMHDLAARYATDTTLGVKNLKKAFELYKRAAELDHPESQYDLGFMYLLGEGCEKDVEKGLKFLKLSALNNYPTANFSLRDIYEEGRFGVAKNKAESNRWKKRFEILDHFKSSTLNITDVKFIKGSKKNYWHIFLNQQRVGRVFITECECPYAGKNKFHHSIQIHINLPFRGRGIGSLAYFTACEKSELDKIYAHMRKSNIASLKAARVAGFVEIIDRNRQLTLVWEKS